MLRSNLRPWGFFEVLYEDGASKLKRIVVSPGRRVSYQTHDRRSEHWLIVSGSGEVTLDGLIETVGAGSAVDVPRGTAHRIHNTGTDDLVFFEIQHDGAYFGEDDIVRIEDDYGRVNAVTAPTSESAPTPTSSERS